MDDSGAEATTQVTVAAIRSLVRQFAEPGNMRQADNLAVPRCIISLLDGDHSSAMFLSQIIYWGDKGTGNGSAVGWFYKSLKEWEDELRLSPRQVRRAIKKLKPFGLETVLRRVKGAPTLHYKLNASMFRERLISHLEKLNDRGTEAPIVTKRDNRKPAQSEKREVSLSDCREVSLSDCTDSSQSSYLHETTSETTSETTHTPREGERSRFTLATCERFARTLPHIENPDGFAWTIFESGKADEKIAAWLAVVDTPREEMPGQRDDESLSKVLAAVSRCLNPESFQQWFAPIERLAIDGDFVRLCVPSIEVRNWIHSNYLDVVAEAMEESGLSGKKLEFWVGGETRNSISAICGD